MATSLPAPARSGEFFLIVLDLPGSTHPISFINVKNSAPLSAPPIDLPADLDAYLAKSESRYADIIPGTEKTIDWAGAPGEQTRVSIAYVHGFTATRVETQPVPQKLAAALGANIFYTRIEGHGRGTHGMHEATLEAWLSGTREAIAIGRRIGEVVVLMGVSTGATAITAVCASDDCHRLAALIFVSPNFGLRDWRSTMLLLPYGKLLAHRLVGPELNWRAANDQHARYWTLCYPTLAVVPVIQLIRLVRQRDLSRITPPVVAFFNDQDKMVRPSRIRATLARFGSSRKELVQVRHPTDSNKHVLAGDVLSPETSQRVLEESLRFIQQSLR